MKVAVSATGTSLDCAVDPRFGRCRCFAIVDTETMSAEFVENTAAAMGSGAGIHAARLVSDRGVDCVLTGHVGPNASETLDAAGIRAVLGCSGTVRDAITQIAREAETGDAHRNDGPEPSARPVPQKDTIHRASAPDYSCGGPRQRGRGRACGDGRGLGRRRGHAEVLAVGAAGGRRRRRG